MNEILNWHDVSFLIQHHWVWLAIAFAAGCLVGLRYNTWKSN